MRFQATGDILRPVGRVYTLKISKGVQPPPGRRPPFVIKKSFKSSIFIFKKYLNDLFSNIFLKTLENHIELQRFIWPPTIVLRVWALTNNFTPGVYGCQARKIQLHKQTIQKQIQTRPIKKILTLQKQNSRQF